MKESSLAEPGRVHWFSAILVFLLVAVLGLTGYSGYLMYRMMRNYAATSPNLPSFAMVQQTVSGQPAPTSEPASESATALPQGAPTTQAAVGSQPTAVVPTPGAAPQGRINILLMGIDQRQGEQGPFRTDTMIVITMDPKAGTVGMLSIPRDLWVPIPGFQENRINTANFLGDSQKYPGGGPALAKKTVTYNLGIPIQYTVRVNFEGFKRVIDTIGGVDINVEKEIRDNTYPDEHYGFDPLYIPVGLVHMDGDLALKYARTRHEDNDFERAHRQQQVILAVKDKVLTFNLLPSLLPKLPELSRTLADAVQTDMPLEEAVSIIKLARSMNTGNVKTVVIDNTMTVPYTTSGGAAVLLPIRDKIRPVIDDLFWGPLPTAPAQ
jgi:polyisoprenyl-teichoic acid--peptidoglycan teichoic acid transferase